MGARSSCAAGCRRGIAAWSRARWSGFTPNSANKDLIHLGDVLKTVNTMKRLGLTLPLGEFAFRESETRTRPPFSPEWIRSRLLAPGALSGLNDKARGIERVGFGSKRRAA